jgi:hypothetical protein
MSMRHCGENPNFLNSVIFSDEAKFYLSGTVNRRNCGYWARKNPYWVQTTYPASPKNLCLSRNSQEKINWTLFLSREFNS